MFISPVFFEHIHFNKKTMGHFLVWERNPYQPESWGAKKEERDTWNDKQTVSSHLKIRKVTRSLATRDFELLSMFRKMQFLKGMAMNIFTTGK